MKFLITLLAALALFVSCAASPKASEKDLSSPVSVIAEKPVDKKEAASPAKAESGASSSDVESAGSMAAPTAPATPAAPAERGMMKSADEGEGESYMIGTGDSSPVTSAAPPSRESAPRNETPTESGLKAGYSDDNDQFNYFVKFLEQYKGEVESYPLNIGERIILTVRDSAGKSVSNADITVQVNGKTVATGRTYASGIFHLFPLEYPDASSYKVLVSYGTDRKTVTVDRKGPRNIEILLQGKRKTMKEVPLDIAFILDTTGSMGEEIERLRSTIEIINENVSAVTPKPFVRFALVLYRDVDDLYVTTVVPFTSDLASFQEELNRVTADGGGDTPEDLQTALSDTLAKLDWNRDGIRLAFTITDAEPHLDYGQKFTYADASRLAKSKGIKLFSVGTGGLPLQGEYILRQISQFTDARYIFLTYGERGESAGGSEASVSHHTGSNFQTDKLETIIIRFTREELAWLSEAPLVVDDPYFDAKKIGGEEKDATLAKLFQDAMKNLVDYSTYSVGPSTKAVLLPVGLNESDSTADMKKQAEYFSEAILLSAMQTKPFIIVERKDLQKLIDEQQLQYSGSVEDSTAVRLGAFLGAEVMVTGRLYLKDGKYEIFLKLLRVETGEILSVSKAKLTRDLGL